jgi:hypothetical protein
MGTAFLAYDSRSVPFFFRGSMCTAPIPPDKQEPAQPVDATPLNRLIRRYFLWRTNLASCTHIKPKQGGVLFDLTLSDEFSLVESY